MGSAASRFFKGVTDMFRRGDEDEAAAGQVRWRARALWFKSYPATQTALAFVLAWLVSAALSIDPATSSYDKIMDIDPSATGALYICYEVLLSFAGHEAAVLLLALAVLLTVPIRYVIFGRKDGWRPSVVLPALAFAACMVVGRSYDLTDSAELVFGGISRTIESLICLAGYFILGFTAVYLLFECFDWFGAHRVKFTEASHGRLWRVADAVLNRHPYAVPFAFILLMWAPTFLAAMPGLFMGDTGAQIRQWFNLPNGTSDYLNLIDPAVLLNGHHPVAHTAFLGGCVQLGITVFGDENAGLLIYTAIQFVLTAACTAYLLSTLYHLGTGLVARAAVLAFFIFIPMFSNYSVLITKDVLFGDAFVLLVVQTAKLLLPPMGARERSRAVVVDIQGSRATGLRIQAVPGRLDFARRDWVLLLLASLGTTFLRNGGVVFPLAAGALAIICRVHDVRAGGKGGRRAYGCVGGVIAVVAVTLAAHLAFTNVLMPALHITPGSRREALSIPFQQTARFVLKHDSAHAGVEGGTDDGLVSDEDRAIIDRVLDYDTLASRYDPDKSDDVKNEFNEDATSEDLSAYFRVWAKMFAQDPAAYLSAIANNYFGYFYPSRKDVWVYSTQSSDETMAEDANTAYFDFHRADGPLTEVCDHLVNLYRVAVQRIPLVSLTMGSSTYVWLLILSSVYLLRSRNWRGLGLFVPLWGVLAVCLIGPCNGSAYMRYLYPMICALPFTMVVALCWPRPARHIAVPSASACALRGISCGVFCAQANRYKMFSRMFVSGRPQRLRNRRLA